MLSTKTTNTLAEIENQVLREKIAALEEENANLKRDLNKQKIQEIQHNQTMLKMNKTIISLKKKWESEIAKQKTIFEDEAKKETLAIREDFLLKSEEMRQNYKKRSQELEELQENYKKDKEEQLNNLKKQLDLKDGSITTLKDQLKTIKSKISVFSQEFKKKYEKKIEKTENEKRNLQKQFTQFSNILSQLADSPNGKGLRTRLENIEKTLKERLSIVQINQELADILVETRNCAHLISENNNLQNSQKKTPNPKASSSKNSENSSFSSSPGTNLLLEYFPDLLNEIKPNNNSSSEPEFEFSDYTDNPPEKNLQILKKEIRELKSKILQNHTFGGFDIEI